VLSGGVEWPIGNAGAVPGGGGGVVRRRVAIHVVFLSAVPVGAVAFALAFFLPEVRLRTATRTADTGEAFGMPSERTSLQEL